MGVQGLKRLLQDRYGRAVSQVNVNAERAEFDHVLIDTNSLLHACVARASVAETVGAIVEELERVALAAMAVKTLVVVVDGPAPHAKIPLQRGRRRQAGLTSQPSDLVTKLHLTPGTEFMSKLTAVLATWAVGKMAAHPSLTVYISGGDVPGEGETKLFTVLQSILHESRAAAGKDSVDDSVCIVGNDTDLLLGCLCMCRAVNLTVLDPTQGIATSTADLVATWLAEMSSAAPGTGKGFLTNTAHLSTARLSFSFIQMLAGNDYLPAVEGVDPHALWCTYTAIDGGRLQLVNINAFGVDVGALATLLRAAVAGRKDGGRPKGGWGASYTPERVKRYLEGIIWCLAGLCGYGCLDYGWTLNTSNDGGGTSGVDLGPTIFDLLKWCEDRVGGGGGAGKKRKAGGGAKQVVIASKASIIDAAAKPVTPLKYLGCVMPPEAWWLVSRGAHALASGGNVLGKKRKRGNEEVEMALATLAGGAAPQDVIDAVNTVYAHVTPGLSSDPRMRQGAAYKLTMKGGETAGMKKKKAAGGVGGNAVDPVLSKLPCPAPPALRGVTAKHWAAVTVAPMPFAAPTKLTATTDALPQGAVVDMKRMTHPYTGLTMDIPAPSGGGGGGGGQRPAKKRKTGVKLDSFLSMDIEV